MSGAVFPPCCLTWGQSMVMVIKIIVTSFKRSHAGTTELSAPNPATSHCWPTPPPETPGHLGASLGQSLLGHCSFFLGSGVHKVFFVPSKSLFPPSCVSSGSSMVGLMATSSKRAYVTPRSTAPRAPAAGHCWPVSPGDTQTQFCLSLCGVCWSCCVQHLFEPSKHRWQVWGLILNVILPLLLSCWGFSLPLDFGVFFWWDPTFFCWWLFSGEL